MTTVTAVPGTVIAGSPRKRTCRVLSRVTLDRCPNEAVTDYGFCAHHLSEAVSEFRRIVQDRDGES